MSATAAEKMPETLVSKLAAVMAAVERVPKNGWNDFHKYHYATEADLSDAVRSNMARYGVMLIPSVDKIEWREIQGNKGAEKIATLTVRFTATDGKDKIEFIIIGEGQDRGDKATYKAMTGATKYALLKLFLIPTGDDPETEEGEQPHTGSRQAPQRPAAKQTPAAAPPPAAPAKSAPAKTIPPAVMKAWERLVEEKDGNKALAKTAWAKAAEAVGAPKDSADWSAQNLAEAMDYLWPKDVP